MWIYNAYIFFYFNSVKHPVLKVHIIYTECVITGLKLIHSFNKKNKNQENQRNSILYCPNCTYWSNYGWFYVYVRYVMMNTCWINVGIMYNEKLNTNPNSIFLITLKPYDVDLPLIFQKSKFDLICRLII